MSVLQPQPMPKQDWFGLFPVRSPLLGESLIVFYSSGYLDVSVHRVSTINGDMSSTCRVTPFGNPYLNDYLHLSMAYRSLSRPSSLLRAKASANCPLLLMIYSIFLPVRQRTSTFLSVENIGVEPMTSCVQGRRSSQLS